MRVLVVPVQSIHTASGALPELRLSEHESPMLPLLLEVVVDVELEVVEPDVVSVVEVLVLDVESVVDVLVVVVGSVVLDVVVLDVESVEVVVVVVVDFEPLPGQLDDIQPGYLTAKLEALESNKPTARPAAKARRVRVLALWLTIPSRRAPDFHSLPTRVGAPIDCQLIPSRFTLPLLLVLNVGAGKASAMPREKCVYP